MPKLPGNLVKPPTFDNPLRRTTPTLPSTPDAPSPSIETQDGKSVELTSDGGVVIPIVTSPRANEDPRTDGDLALEIEHRITVRIDDATRQALEGACYKRRIAGEKTNVAEITRKILKSWASRQAQ